MLPLLYTRSLFCPNMYGMGVFIAPHTAPHLHAHLVAAFGDKAFGAESHGDPDRHPIQHGLYSGGPDFRGGRLHLSEP
jgi:hypothetical protein